MCLTKINKWENLHLLGLNNKSQSGGERQRLAKAFREMFLHQCLWIDFLFNQISSWMKNIKNNKAWFPKPSVSHGCWDLLQLPPEAAVTAAGWRIGLASINKKSHWLHNYTLSHSFLVKQVTEIFRQVLDVIKHHHGSSEICRNAEVEAAQYSDRAAESVMLIW